MFDPAVIFAGAYVELLVVPINICPSVGGVDVLVPPLVTPNIPVTPVVSGKPVKFVATPDAGVPNAGDTNVLLDNVCVSVVPTIAPTGKLACVQILAESVSVVGTPTVNVIVVPFVAVKSSPTIKYAPFKYRSIYPTVYPPATVNTVCPLDVI